MDIKLNASSLAQPPLFTVLLVTSETKSSSTLVHLSGFFNFKNKEILFWNVMAELAVHEDIPRNMVMYTSSN